MAEETERDANMALVELDKGLRSIKQGEQIECITSFSDVFNKHPFPMFINSASLKLADCFNVSNNYVRLCIVKVYEESHKHLGKIHNVDEFLASIFQVVHSNDPVARAVTIRCLAACSPILKERKNVHHAILEALSSHDQVEVKAAIHAITEFSKVSQTFNMGAIDCIASKIQTAPVSMKLALIPTLQHMDASQDMTQRARLICEDLLSNYVVRGMVTRLLDTMTMLCCRSLTNIPQQLELLFDWLTRDVRQCVQLSALRNIGVLLKGNPHHLTPQHVRRLLTYEQKTSDSRCRSALLHILTVSISSLTAPCFIDGWSLAGEDNSIIDTLLATFSIDLDLKISSQCLSLCTNLLTSLPQATNRHTGEITLAIQSLILAAVFQPHMQALKEALICIKLLAGRLESRELVDTLYTVLKSDASDECCVLVCETLMIIPLPLQLASNDLLNVLETRKHNGKLAVLLCAVVFYTHSPSSQMPMAILTSLVTLLHDLDPWTVYRVCRQALRFGQYELAVQLSDRLLHQVMADHSYRYITCLHLFAQSRLSLQHLASTPAHLQLAVLDEALTWLSKSIRSIEAVDKDNKRFHFHSTYLRLLHSELFNHRTLQSITNMYWSCPPPAIGRVEGARTGDDLVRYGRLTEELRGCSADVHKLYEEFTCLQQKLLDADEASHQHIKLLMERTFLMCQLLDTVLTGETQFTCSAKSTDEVWDPIKRRWPRSTSISESHELSITHQQLDALKSASHTLLTMNSLPLPRYAFQRLQTTSATMNITPHHKAGEAVLVHYHSHLTLTVEAIVSYSNPDASRKAKKALVIVSSHRNSSSEASSTSDGKGDVSSPSNITKAVPLSNDYVCMELLLSFPQPGQYTVNIVCKVLDCNDIEWDIDCNAELLVKSFKEKRHSTFMK